MKHLSKYFLLAVMLVAPSFSFAVDTPNITSYDSNFKKSGHHETFSWETNVRGECTLYLSRESGFQDATRLIGDFNGSEVRNDIEYFKYIAYVGDVNYEVKQYYKVSCQFPDFENKIVETAVDIRVGDAEDNASQNTFTPVGPTVVSYTTNSQSGLDYIFSANYDGTCWVQYDTSNSFANAQLVATSLIENPSSSNGNVYKYKGVVSNANPNIYYYVRALCNYGGKQYVNSDVVWSASDPNFSNTATTPTVTLDDIYSKSEDSGSSFVTFGVKWKTNVPATCKTLSSNNSDYTNTLYQSLGSTTRTQVGSSYIHETSFLAVPLTTEHVKAQCTYNGQSFESSWHSYTNVDVAQSLDIDVKWQNRQVQPDGTVVLEFNTNHEALCSIYRGEYANMSDATPTNVRLVQKPLSTNDGRAYYDLKLYGLKSNTSYYYQVSCEFNNKLYKSDVYGVQAGTVNPHLDLKSLDVDGNGKITYLWTSNVPASCEALMSQNTDYSNRSALSATRKQDGDKYVYESSLTHYPNVNPYPVYYLSASCTYNGQTLTLPWKKIDATPKVKPTIQFEALSKDTNTNDIYYKWSTNVNAPCEAFVSLTGHDSDAKKYLPQRSVVGSSYDNDIKIESNFFGSNTTGYVRVYCRYDAEDLTLPWQKFDVNTLDITRNYSNTRTALSIPTIEDVNVDSLGVVRFDLRSREKADCGIQYSRFLSMNPAFIARGLVIGEGQNAYDYQAKVADMKPDTTYYYRAFCKKDGNSVYGATARLVTPQATRKSFLPPTVESIKADHQGNVEMEMTSTFEGNCGVEISKSVDITQSMNVKAKKSSKVINGRNHLIGYELKASGLALNSKYYYRPYCQANGSTTYAAVGWFETPKQSGVENVQLVDLVVKELGDSNRQTVDVRPVTQRVSSNEVNEKARKLANDDFDGVLKELNVLRNKVKEQEAQIKYLNKLIKRGQEVNEQMKSALSQFIAYGVDDKTKKQGEGQRASVVSSFQEAYGRLPENNTELSDVILLAQGDAPINRNPDAEKSAYEQFIKIYKRVPNLEDVRDQTAISIMTYGRLNSAKRNLNSEKAAQGSFKAIYNKLPESTQDWNNLRAITYSGATRMPDADKDLLPDELEKKIGSNPNVADTDGDGYPDGREYLNGYNPMGPGIL